MGGGPRRGQGGQVSSLPLCFLKSFKAHGEKNVPGWVFCFDFKPQNCKNLLKHVILAWLAWLAWPALCD